jgi:outer membrane protein assembly factor BamB
MSAGAACQAVPAACNPACQSWKAYLHVGNSTPLSEPASQGNFIAVATSAVETFSHDGKLLWTRPLRAYQPRGLVFTTNSIVVAEKGVYALSTSSGELLWTFGSERVFARAKALVMDDLIIAGDEQHEVYALDQATGRLVWKIDCLPDRAGKAVVTGFAQQGGVLYVSLTSVKDREDPSDKGYVVSIEPKSQHIRWRYVTEATKERVAVTDATEIVGNHILAIDAIGNHVFALERDTGKLLWSFHGESDRLGISSIPAVIGNLILVASGDKNIYAIRLLDGTIAWKRTLDASIVSMRQYNDLLFVSTGRLLILDENANLLASPDLALSGPVLSPIGIWDGGVLIVDSHSLHVLRCDRSMH